MVDGATGVVYSVTDGNAVVPAGSISLAAYGAVGDGVTDDSAAIAAALLAANGARVFGVPGKTYLSTSAITVTTSVDLDLCGATLKPSGASGQGLRRDAPSVTASTTISSGATIGSRSFVVASATGIVVGQCFRAYATDTPTNDDYTFPPGWAKVTGVSGTTITIDSPFRVTYSGTINAYFYDASSMLSEFRFRGKIDGSATTYNSTTGQGIRVGGFSKVDIEADLIDFDNANSNTCAIQIYVCLDADVKVRATGTVSQSNIVDFQVCRFARLIHSDFDGDSFGANLLTCDYATAAFNNLRGRRWQNSNDAVSPVRSTRGIKMYGCGYARALYNDTSDYESPIKVESCHKFQVIGNTLTDCGLEASYTGSVALNISNQVDGNITQNGIVAFNTVVNCGGIGIGVSNSTGYGKVIVANNQVIKCQGRGIYVNVANAQILHNRVEDWGLRASTDVGIHYSTGATVIGNRFSNSVQTGLSCLRSFFQSSYVYDFRDNVCETANPMGVTFEAVGTGSIASGATSATITHTLSRTPAASNFTIQFTENPTNDNGNVWLSSIGSATATLNVRNDPGASNLDFGWRVAIPMPFTA